jgi:hypothetical protein
MESTERNLPVLFPDWLEAFVYRLYLWKPIHNRKAKRKEIFTMMICGS